MNNLLRFKYRYSGFSLIELLLVLGVLAILLVAAFVVYPQVRDRNQANTEAANLRAIQANVRSLFYSKGGSFRGLGNGKNAGDRGVANQARVFPSTMNGGDYSADVQVKTTWGGDVWVWKRPAVTTPKGAILADRSFGILLEGVPRGVCVPLVAAVGNDFMSVTVASQEVLSSDGLETARLVQACNSSTNSVSLMFTSN